MDPHESTPAHSESSGPGARPRRPAGGGLLSTFILVVAGLVLLGGLAVAVTYFIAYRPRGGTPVAKPGELPAGARLVASIDTPLDEIFALGYTADGKLVGAGDGAQGVYVYDAVTGQPAGTAGEKRQLDGGGFAFVGPDRLMILTRNRVALWDMGRKAEVRTLAGGNRSYAGSPTARLAVISETGGMGSKGKGTSLKVWGAEDESPRAHRSDEDAFDGLAFSPDGKLLASTGGKGGSIKVYRMPQVELLRTIGQGQGEYGTRLAFSPDGKTLASTGGKELRLWSVETGQELPALEGKRAAALCCFSRDGKALATYAFEDRGVKLWDVASRKERAFLPTYQVDQVAFSPAADVLALGEGGKTIKLIDVAELFK